MRPTDSSVSPAALSLVLDALETECPITRKSLAKVTGLGLSTVGRALSACMTHGILSCEAGIDPDGGRPCRTYTPAGGLLLPLLTLTRSHGCIRILDTTLHPAHTAVTELHPAAPTEEAARILARRLVIMLRGCNHGSVASPVLLTDPSLPSSVLRDSITHTLGTPPLTLLSHEEAVARALGCVGIPRTASSVLFLSVGEGAHACLLLREGAGKWCPSPLGRGLTHTLTRTLRAAEPCAEGARRATVVFLTDLCRFMTPDLIYVEDPRGILPDKDFFAPLLLDGVRILVGGTGNGRPTDSLTMAERGAALVGRRMLWDRILMG